MAGKGEIHWLIGIVEWEDEEFAAEAAPGDEHFPEEGAVHGRVGVVEEIDDGAVVDEVLAERVAEGWSDGVEGARK